MRSMNEHNATEQAYKHGYEKGRADAVKEFAEQIKKHCTSIELNEYIDTLVQEMVGEEDG